MKSNVERFFHHGERKGGESKPTVAYTTSESPIELPRDTENDMDAIIVETKKRRSLSFRMLRYIIINTKRFDSK